VGSLHRRKAHLPKTFSTPQLGCFHSLKLIYGDVVEIPRIFGCTAAQSELLASLTELPNIQEFWTNLKY
ncbi:unnamed protein product, partial [Bubo scandiacus]